MYEIELNQRYQDTALFESYGKRQYRDLGQIRNAIDGKLKIQKVKGQDEWRLLWSASYREIGRVRVVPTAPAPKPRRTVVRDGLIGLAHAALAIICFWR